MSKTSGFEWSFGAGTTRDRNSASSAALNFSAAGRYISFVRESVQNSLDFPLDGNKPVEMRFSVSEISKSDYPELFALGEHIKECKSISVENPRAQKEYSAMVDRFFPAGHEVQKLKVLTVSDYNTKGMYYDDSDEMAIIASPFYCFALSEGSSRKFGAGPAGGSYGFGKNAYFSMSPFKTLVVSTCVGEGDLKGSHFMLGVSALIAHLHNGEKVSDYGCFGLKENPVVPVSDTSIIPKLFSRDTPGTDMHIVGTFDESDDFIYLSLKKALLNHFWLAILDKKLIVTVGTEKISHENLDSVIKNTFFNVKESGYARSYDDWCPTEYYDALVNGRLGKDPAYVHFSEKLPLIGDVHLYLHVEDGAKDRIAYLRGLRMVVEKKERRTGYGYYGVFFCEDPEGNKLLGQLEPFEHNAWDSKNWLDEVNGNTHPDAKKIMSAIETFVDGSINKVFTKEGVQEIPMPGLSSLLGGEPVAGNPYGEQDDGDGGGNNADRREIWESTSPKSAAAGDSTADSNRVTMVMHNKVAYRDPQGTTTIVVRSKKSDRHRVRHGGSRPGHKKNVVRLADGKDHPCALVPIEVHVINPSNDASQHLVVFELSKAIERAHVKFDAGTDNGKSQKGELELDKASISGSPLNVTANAINTVSLNKGKNSMLVSFKDGIRHALEVEIYELED